MLIQRFRRFPYWLQVVITLGSVGILVVLWSACGLPPPRPHPAPPPPASRLESSGSSQRIGPLPKQQLTR